MTTSNQAEADRLINDAIADGKLHPTNRATWQALFKKDPGGAKAVLAQVPGGLIPVEAGYRRDIAEDSAEAELASVYAKVVGAPLDQPRRPQRSPAVRAAQSAPAVNGLDETVTTYEELDAAIRSDPGMHRALWDMGVRSIEKPPTQITGWKDPNAPYIAMNADGTGQWVNPARERRTQEMDALAVQDRALREQQAEREAEAQAKYREDKNKWRGM